MDRLDAEDLPLPLSVVPLSVALLSAALLSVALLSLLSLVSLVDEDASAFAVSVFDVSDFAVVLSAFFAAGFVFVLDLVAMIVHLPTENYCSENLDPFINFVRIFSSEISRLGRKGRISISDVLERSNKQLGSGGFLSRHLTELGAGAHLAFLPIDAAAPTFVVVELNFRHIGAQAGDIEP